MVYANSTTKSLCQLTKTFYIYSTPKAIFPAKIACISIMRLSQGKQPKKEAALCSYFFSKRSRPPMYGLNTLGIVTLPSACWLFSNRGIRTLGEAIAVLFRV